MKKELDLFIVTPAYNEAGSLEVFVSQIKENLSRIGGKIHLVVVNDGSLDNTIEVMREVIIKYKSDNFFINCIDLSRNFGHQSALMAGLEWAFNQSNEDSLFLMMDSDLEHPPSLIPLIVEKMFDKDIDHLQMIRKDSNKNLSIFKNLTSVLYYKIFRYFTKLQLREGSADFRCINYKVLKSFLSLDEVERFNRGLFQWIGFKIDYIDYDVGKRISGQTSYTLKKMIDLAIRGITSFSVKPLTSFHLFSILLSLVISIVYVLLEVYRLIILDIKFEPGWLTIIASVFFWGGILSFGQFMQSLYLSKMFNEVKHRPLYIVKKIY
jgi:glycosyltransferase involved in cell wall biosynthesis